MNATATIDFVHAINCPESGLTLQLERDPTAIHWWTASVFVDIGGYTPLFLNSCGDSPWAACWSLHCMVNTVHMTVQNIAPEVDGAHGLNLRRAADTLMRLWGDTLNLRAADINGIDPDAD